jgi:hypothetical protein
VDPRFKSEFTNHGAALFGNDTLIPNLAYLRHVQATRPDLLSKVTFELHPFYYLRSLFGHENAVRQTGRRPADAPVNDRGYARRAAACGARVAGLGLLIGGVAATAATAPGHGRGRGHHCRRGLIGLPALFSYLNRPHPFRALWGISRPGGGRGRDRLSGSRAGLGLGAESTALNLLAWPSIGFFGGYPAGRVGFQRTGRPCATPCWRRS